MSPMLNCISGRPTTCFQECKPERKNRTSQKPYCGSTLGKEICPCRNMTITGSPFEQWAVNSQIISTMQYGILETHPLIKGFGQKWQSFHFYLATECSVSKNTCNIPIKSIHIQPLPFKWYLISSPTPHFLPELKYEKKSSIQKPGHA